MLQRIISISIFWSIAYIGNMIMSWLEPHNKIYRWYAMVIGWLLTIYLARG